MDSANLHHQPFLQADQPVGSSSSSSSYSSSSPTSSSLSNSYSFGFNGISSHSWTSSSPTSITSPIGHLNQNYSIEAGSNSMIQNMGFQYWTNNAAIGSYTNHQQSSPHDSHIRANKIKDELSEMSFPKFTDMLNSSIIGSTNNIISDCNFLDQHPNTSQIKNKHKDFNQEYLSEKLLLKTLSSSYHQTPSASLSFGSRGHCSQIYPSVNVPSLNNQPTNSTILRGNLDHLASSAATSFAQHPLNINVLGNFRDNNHSISLDHHQMQYPHRLPSSSIGKFTSSNNTEIIEEKRTGSSVEPKATQAAPKKSRCESRTSCPPFKVRKEKLGDRVAALQQLVAPFGKTDTASVLMEAIGYIKFLQNQVETLSVPYMKSHRNKSYKKMQGDQMHDGKEEGKRDLRSRGLCLVPLNSMSYLTGDHSGDGNVWPPPNFG